MKNQLLSILALVGFLTTSSAEEFERKGRIVTFAVPDGFHVRHTEKLPYPIIHSEGTFTERLVFMFTDQVRDLDDFVRAGREKRAHDLTVEAGMPVEDPSEKEAAAPGAKVIRYYEAPARIKERDAVVRMAYIHFSPDDLLIVFSVCQRDEKEVWRETFNRFAESIELQDAQPARPDNAG